MKSPKFKFSTPSVLMVATIVAAQTLTTGALAQGEAVNIDKPTLVEECLAVGPEMSPADKELLTVEITSWKNVFATKLIADTRNCLNLLTGEVWQYSRMLNGFVTLETIENDAAERQASKQAEAAAERASKQAEAASAAAERAAERAREQAEAASAAAERAAERARGRLFVEATERVQALELEVTRGMQAEVMVATFDACAGYYRQDKQSAMLSPVCNQFFLDAGLPDTVFSFQTDEIIEAKRLAIETSQLLEEVIND
jgi:hypothetical protein